MASPIENSDNFAITITGLEIVPYVPPETNGDEGFQTPKNQSPIIIPLVKVILKPEEVEKVSYEGLVKAVPISFKLPKHCLSNILRTDKDQDQDQDQADHDSMPMHTMRHSTKIICTAGPITFKLPEDCVDYTMKLDEEEKQVNPSTGRFSLFERLQGWTIEKRQRDSRRFDKYYYHGMSNRMFRSFAEVVRFLIYGLYPQKPQQLNDNKTQEDHLVVLAETSRQTPFKRKRAPQTFNRSTKLEETQRIFPSIYWEEPTIKTVEEMLEEAYENMQLL